MTWQLLKCDYNIGIELWKTPTKFLVCQRDFRQYKIVDTEKEACEIFERKINGEAF